jgi:hypothetical protein
VSGSVAFPSPGKFSLTLWIIRADKATVESTLTQPGNYPDGWLPTIESLAKEVSTRVQIQKKESIGRSEFEVMTWLPEAALPFFKGLDYYSRGDYALAVPWFRHSYEKDQHFDLARRWEARAYQKLNLSILAETLSGAGTNSSFGAMESKRPVAAVVASDNISAAGRAAFVQVLAQAGRFQIKQLHIANELRLRRAEPAPQVVEEALVKRRRQQRWSRPQQTFWFGGLRREPGIRRFRRGRSRQRPALQIEHGRDRVLAVIVHRARAL